MHIAFWSPAWPLEKHQNGIITYVHWMKRELEGQGHRVTVFTANLDSTSSEPGVIRARPGLWSRFRRRLLGPRTFTADDGYAFSAVIAETILRAHRRDPIDVLEMEESFGWFAEVGRRTSLPILVKLHGPAFLHLVPEQLATPSGQEKVEREGRALRFAGVLAAPSQFTLDRTIERYGLTPKERGRIVNPLVMDDDTPLWSLDACEPGTVLYVGRFDRIKGADVILKAFMLAAKRRPQLKLIFVGPDHGLLDSDGSKIHFAAYCESLFGPELRDRIDYRGSLPNRQVAELRTRAMVTVVASRMENQSYAVLETMLQGCPLVCADSGGCPESVIDGITGRLAKSEVPDDFAEKIIAMIDDPRSAANMGQEARRYVREKHSLKEVAAVSLAYYQKAIGLSRSGR